MNKITILIVLSIAALLAGGLIYTYSDDLFEQNEESHVSDLENSEYSHNHDSHHHGEIEAHENEDEDHIVFNNEQMEKFGIEVQEAIPGQLDIILLSRGKIVQHPDRLAHVLPKIPGVAKEARKNIGDKVYAGEVIAVLESREFADVKASYLAALEKHNLALELFERESRLYKNKVSPEQDFLNSKSAYAEAKINLELGKQRLKAFGLDENEISNFGSRNDPDFRIYEIKSPIDGIVTARHITQGEYIEDNKAIYEISDLSKVWVEIGLYPKDILKVKEGQIVQIVMPADELQTSAEIIYVSPYIQEDSITGIAVAEIDNNNGQWRPGTFVKANILTDKIDVPTLVPISAIQTIEGDNVIFVKTEEGFEKRPVNIGKCDLTHQEVLSGLNEGEKFACTKTFLLKAELKKSEATEHDD